MSTAFTEAELSEDQVETVRHAPCRVEKGDLWLLGDHLLYCGDSEDYTTITALLGDETAKCVFTDPPYQLEKPGGAFAGVGIQTTFSDLEQARITTFDPSLFLRLLPSWFEDGYHCSYIFHSDAQTFDYLRFARAQRLRHYQMVWEKLEQPAPIGNSHWKDFELCLRLHKGCSWQHSRGVPGLWRGRALTTRRIPRLPGSHPTSKPVEWIMPQLQMVTQVGDIVADPYAGSGSTLIACERLHRRCIAIEHAPQWCALIIARWEAETGRQAWGQPASDPMFPIPPFIRHSSFFDTPNLKLV